MGLRFSRVGSDPYYANYEKALTRIQEEVKREDARALARDRIWRTIKGRSLAAFAAVYVLVLAQAAWVLHAIPGEYTWQQHSARVSLVLLVPLLALVLFRAAGGVVALADRRTAGKKKSLEQKLRKMLTELKDSTRYDQTQKLLCRFDPDYALAVVQPQPRPAMPAPGRGLAASTLAGAGSKIGPVLGDLWTRVADRLIADDPTALGLVQEAQREADMLKQQLVQAAALVRGLYAENAGLREQLGLLPPEALAPAPDALLLEADAAGGVNAEGSGSWDGPESRAGEADAESLGTPAAEDHAPVEADDESLVDSPTSPVPEKVEASSEEAKKDR